MQTPQYKRRRRLIQPRLQIKLILSFLGLTAVALLSQFLLLVERLSASIADMPEVAGQMSEVLPGVLLRVLALSFVTVLPAAFLIGIWITHRIAGPIYRFEQHLSLVAQGERPGPCTIRKEDELQELCELMNDALERARADGETEEPDEAANEPLRAAG